MKIAGYQGTTLIDWPGKVASLVFVSGCNFSCPFCHNRGLVRRVKGSKAQRFKEEEILKDLQKRKKWIDGVVISGGEPTLQKDLPEFLTKLKKIGLATMIETNGSRPEIIRALLTKKLLAYIAMDIKGPLDKNYLRITNSGSRITNIKKSLKEIFESGIPFELRTTVVPGIHDEKVLLQMARQLLRLTSRVSRFTDFPWFLQAFRPKNCLDPRFNKLQPYSRMEMENFLAAVKKIIPETELR